MSLIDREALLRAYDAGHDGPAGRARKLIEDAPAVDAEPVRHGHWKSCRFSDGGLYQKQCSVCGGWSHDIGSYCPNCGAKMDKKECGDD